MGIREARAPFPPGGGRRLARVFALPRLLCSALRRAERRGCGDGDEVRRIVEREHAHAPHSRLAGEQKDNENNRKKSLHTSSRMAAIGSRRDAARAGYHVARIESAIATTVTEATSS